MCSKFRDILLIAKPRGVSWFLKKKIVVASLEFVAHLHRANYCLPSECCNNDAGENKLRYIESPICLLAHYSDQDYHDDSPYFKSNTSWKQRINLYRPLFACLVKQTKQLSSFKSGSSTDTRHRVTETRAEEKNHENISIPVLWLRLVYPKELKVPSLILNCLLNQVK